jgi:DNA-binding response OmpR family regulator
MAVTVVLAVGLDPWMLMAQDSAWRSEGYIVVSVHSIRDAIDHFKAGDFDLVLLGHSMTIENQERLTFLIRASGSNTPVVCISSSGGVSYTFADATLRNDPTDLLVGIKELLARRTRLPAAEQAAYSAAT